MTTRGEVTLRIGADVSGAFRSVNRLFDHAEQRARQLDARTGGIGSGIGRGIGGAGRGGIGVGQIALGGFGANAGFAIVEQLIERVLELFEDTQLLDDFSAAMTTLFEAFGPVVGVLLDVFTPILLALVPVFDALVPAITPLIELLGFGLLAAILVLTPIIELLARWFGIVAGAVRDFIGGALLRFLEILNAFPGIDIDLDPLRELIDGTDRLAESQRQLTDAQRARREEDEANQRSIMDALNSRFDRVTTPLSILEAGGRVTGDGRVLANPAFGPNQRRPTPFESASQALFGTGQLPPGIGEAFAPFNNQAPIPGVFQPIQINVQIDGTTIDRSIQTQQEIRKEAGRIPSSGRNFRTRSQR